MRALTLLLLLALPACGLLQRSTRQPVDFVEAGQILLGPLAGDSAQRRVDVVFSGGVWDENSAQGGCHPHTEVVSSQIEFSVSRCLVDTSKPGRELSLELGALEPGIWPVVYVDPDGTRHPVGSVEVR